MDESKVSGFKGTSLNGVVSMLATYDQLGWAVVSGDMGYDETAGKKRFDFHSKSWKDDPVCREGATGYALRTGPISGVMAIDIDDPTRPHNQTLMKMCEEAGAIKQVTRKGIHYLFKSDERLRTTTNAKLALDIRNLNGLLYVEPSRYNVAGRTQFYKFQNLPTSPDGVPECPQSIVDFINSIFRPNLTTEQRKTIRETVKKENAGMDKLKVDISKTSEDVRTALMSINVEHCENYSDWIKVGLALHHEGLGWELFDEFSRRSPKYREGEPYHVYESFANRPTEEPISLRTIYWWLKNENDAVFKTLINKEENEEYIALKKKHEETCCVIGSKIMFQHSNGRFEMMSHHDAIVKYMPHVFRQWEDGKMVKQSFYHWWMKDPTRKEYDRMDFLPPPLVCPPNVYNLYKGMVAETLPPVPDEEVMDLIQPILRHIATLMPENEDGDCYFALNFLAQLIQEPGIKSEVALVLRDIHRLLAEGGGNGKNLLLEFLGDKVIGEKYVVTIANNDELYNPFTEHLEHKLLVFVPEANGSVNGKQIEYLKEMVTQKKRSINRKGVPKYDSLDHARYIFAANTPNPMGSSGGTPGDRRFAYYDVDTSHREDKKYFGELKAAMDDPRVARAFYQYLKAFKCYKNPLEFQMNRPHTKAWRSLRRMNVSPILRWVIHKVEQEDDIDGEASSMFKEFQTWMTENKEEADLKMSQSAFTRFMKENPFTKEVEGVNRGAYKSSTTHITLNMDHVRRELIKQEYMKPKAMDLRDLWAEVTVPTT